MKQTFSSMPCTLLPPTSPAVVPCGFTHSLAPGWEQPVSPVRDVTSALLSTWWPKTASQTLAGETTIARLYFWKPDQAHHRDGFASVP